MANTSPMRLLWNAAEEVFDPSPGGQTLFARQRKELPTTPLGDATNLIRIPKPGRKGPRSQRNPAKHFTFNSDKALPEQDQEDPFENLEPQTTNGQQPGYGPERDEKLDDEQENGRQSSQSSQKSQSLHRNRGVRKGTKRGAYRRLGQEQRELLERVFEHTQKPGSETRAQLASELGVEEDQIWHWFRNRRTKRRREQDGSKHSQRRRNSLPAPQLSVSIPVSDLQAHQEPSSSLVGQGSAGFGSERVQINAHISQDAELGIAFRLRVLFASGTPGSDAITLKKALVNPQTGKGVMAHFFDEGECVVARGRSMEEIKEALLLDESGSGIVVVELYGHD